MKQAMVDSSREVYDSMRVEMTDMNEKEGGDDRHE